MSSLKRIVFRNGTDMKCKVLGLRNNSVVVRGKHRKIYFNADHVKTIDYVTLERLSLSMEMPFGEVLD